MMGGTFDSEDFPDKTNGLTYIFLTIILLFLTVAPSTGQPKLFQFDTRDLRTIYMGRGYSYMVPHKAR